MNPILTWPLWIYVAHILTWLSLVWLFLAFRKQIERVVDLMRSNSNTVVAQRASDRLVASGAAISTLSVAVLVNVPLFVAIAFGFAVFFGTPMFLKRRRLIRYQKEFDASLVESLTTIGSSLKAGLTLRDALVVAVQNCPPVFSAEMARVLKDYRFGMSIDRALDRVRHRVRTKNATIAIGALIIGTQLGGRLPEVLARIVSTIREVDRVEGRLKALTSQGRTQGVLLCSMPVIIFIGIYIFDHEKIQVMQTTAVGQFLLGLVVFLEIVGILVTLRVMRLEV